MEKIVINSLYLLSLRNFMLYLPHSLAGEFLVWVKILLMILARN